MFSSVANYHNVLMVLDIILVLICCFLLVRLPVNYHIKYIAIPILLFSVYASLVLSKDYLGKAYEMDPVGEFEFKDYRIVKKDGVKKVELWIIQGKESRLLLVAYPASDMDSIEQILARARTKAQKGLMPMMTMKKKKPLFPGDNNFEITVTQIDLQSTQPPK